MSYSLDLQTYIQIAGPPVDCSLGHWLTGAAVAALSKGKLLGYTQKTVTPPTLLAKTMPKRRPLQPIAAQTHCAALQT